MAPPSETRILKSLRRELAVVMSQIEHYESGHADWGVANGIYAAHKRKQMSAKLRERASNLRILIAAYEKGHA